MNDCYHSSIPSSVPLNNVSHVSVENLGFVLALRAEVNNQHDGRKQASKGSTKGSKTSAEAQPVKPVRFGDCINPQCLERAKDAINAQEERLTLHAQLETLADMLFAAEAQLHGLEEDHRHVEQAQDTLLQKQSAQDLELSRGDERLLELSREARQLEEQISEAHAVIRHEKEAAVAKPHAAGKAKPSRKHNGVYNMQTSGTPMWSCCLHGEADGNGCIEEHSVGIRSALGFSKQTINANRILPKAGHPLTAWNHSTMSMEAAKRYAFWSTKSDPSIMLRPSTASLQQHHSSSMMMRSSTHLHHADSHKHSSANRPLSSNGHGHHNRHQHRQQDDSDDDDEHFPNHRQSQQPQATQHWAPQRPPSGRLVGKVRTEEGTLRKQNRPMSSPAGYSRC